LSLTTLVTLNGFRNRLLRSPYPAEKVVSAAVVVVVVVAVVATAVVVVDAVEIAVAVAVTVALLVSPELTELLSLAGGLSSQR